MSVPPQDSRQRLADAEDVLRQAGVKVTHQRLEILREVLANTDHPDADTVFRAVRERLPSVSLDTVYRTLWLFADLGLITTLGVPRERLRFDSNAGPHHHFVCTQCGQTRDLTCPAFDLLTAPEAVRTFGTVARVQVEFRGLCHDCAASGPDPASASVRPHRQASRSEGEDP